MKQPGKQPVKGQLAAQASQVDLLRLGGLM
jgi:hypothetical protein